MTPKKTPEPYKRKKMSSISVTLELDRRVNDYINKTSPLYHSKAHFVAVHLGEVIDRLEKEQKEREERK